MTIYHPVNEYPWRDPAPEEDAMPRKLRDALEIVSDIGALGFDLQHHDDIQIKHAVAVLRSVNGPLFSWLVQVLGVDGGSVGDAHEVTTPANLKEQPDAFASAPRGGGETRPSESKP